MAFFKEKLELRIAESELWVRELLGNFAPWQRKVITLCLLLIIPGYIGAKALGYSMNQKQLAPSLLTAKPSFTSSQNIQIGTVRIAKSGNTTYSAAVKIVNPNTDLSLPETTAKLEFKSGKEVVYSEDVKFFLLPGQSKELVVPRAVSISSITSGELILPEKLSWQKRFSIQNVKLNASTPSAYNQTEPTAFVVEGAVANQSPYLLKKTVINFVLYDKQGAMLGASSRSEFDIKPFERRAYKQLWPGIYTDSVTRVEVLPETNTLDSSNLILPDSTGGASDLGR